MSHHSMPSDFEAYTHPERDTKQALVQAMFNRARTAGDLQEIEPILDYILPSDTEPLERSENIPLTNYRFDIVPTVRFGGSEGIYVEVRMEGEFDESGRRSALLATVKSLQEDLHACKLMGTLCGVLLYHATAYINQNIHRYTPQQELEAEYHRKQERNAG